VSDAIHMPEIEKMKLGLVEQGLHYPMFDRARAVMGAMCKDRGL